MAKLGIKFLAISSVFAMASTSVGSMMTHAAPPDGFDNGTPPLRRNAWLSPANQGNGEGEELYGDKTPSKEITEWPEYYTWAPWASDLGGRQGRNPRTRFVPDPNGPVTAEVLEAMSQMGDSRFGEDVEPPLTEVIGEF